jgi:NitT/TauT family transport system ATP-binding protein
MSSNTIIDVKDVTKEYNSDSGPIRAVNNTSLAIDDAAFISIVGPSGCGKTTLLKMLGGLIPTTTGEITIKGDRVLSPREDIGFVFQNAVLLPWKSVIENVLLPIQVHRRVTAADRRRAGEILDLVGLNDFHERYPFELSGGMQQRVSICRALVNDPACLLLDEPFGALDALTRENINVFFNALWVQTGKTVVMVTHSIQEAVFLSTRIIVMTARPGEIVDDVTVPFPRKREPEIIGSSEFGDLTNKIRRYFSSNGMD